MTFTLCQVLSFLHICITTLWFMWGKMHIELSSSQILLWDRLGFSNAIYNNALSRPTTVFHHPWLSTPSSITLNQLICTLGVFHTVFLMWAYSNAFSWNAEEHLLLMLWGLILTIRQVLCHFLIANPYSNASVLELHLGFKERIFTSALKVHTFMRKKVHD